MWDAAWQERVSWRVVIRGGRILARDSQPMRPQPRRYQSAGRSSNTGRKHAWALFLVTLAMLPTRSYPFGVDIDTFSETHGDRSPDSGDTEATACLDARRSSRKRRNILGRLKQPAPCAARAMNQKVLRGRADQSVHIEKETAVPRRWVESLCACAVRLADEAESGSTSSDLAVAGEHRGTAAKFLTRWKVGSCWVFGANFAGSPVSTCADATG